MLYVLEVGVPGHVRSLVWLAESGLDSKQVRLGLSGPAYIYMQHLVGSYQVVENKKRNKKKGTTRALGQSFSCACSS